MFIHFDRQRDSMRWGGAERGGDTESEAGSRLRAISTEPDAELEQVRDILVPILYTTKLRLKKVYFLNFYYFF